MGDALREWSRRRGLTEEEGRQVLYERLQLADPYVHPVVEGPEVKPRSGLGDWIGEAASAPFQFGRGWLGGITRGTVGAVGAIPQSAAAAEQELGGYEFGAAPVGDAPAEYLTGDGTVLGEAGAGIGNAAIWGYNAAKDPNVAARQVGDAVGSLTLIGGGAWGGAKAGGAIGSAIAPGIGTAVGAGIGGLLGGGAAAAASVFRPSALRNIASGEEPEMAKRLARTEAVVASLMAPISMASGAAGAPAVRAVSGAVNAVVRRGAGAAGEQAVTRSALRGVARGMAMGSAGEGAEEAVEGLAVEFFQNLVDRGVGAQEAMSRTIEHLSEVGQDFMLGAAAGMPGGAWAGAARRSRVDGAESGLPAPDSSETPSTGAAGPTGGENAAAPAAGPVKQTPDSANSTPDSGNQQEESGPERAARLLGQREADDAAAAPAAGAATAPTPEAAADAQAEREANEKFARAAADAADEAEAEAAERMATEAAQEWQERRNSELLRERRWKELRAALDEGAAQQRLLEGEEGAADALQRAAEENARARQQRENIERAAGVPPTPQADAEEIVALGRRRYLEQHAPAPQDEAGTPPPAPAAPAPPRPGPAPEETAAPARDDGEAAAPPPPPAAPTETAPGATAGPPRVAETERPPKPKSLLQAEERFRIAEHNLREVHGSQFHEVFTQAYEAAAMHLEEEYTAWRATWDKDDGAPAPTEAAPPPPGAAAAQAENEAPAAATGEAEADVAPVSDEVKRLSLDQLTLDAAKFQFRHEEADKSGATGRIGDVKFHDRSASSILVKELPDGKYVVVNGHQRVNFARRAAAKGQTGISFVARILPSSMSDRQARLEGTKVNLTELNGEATGPNIPILVDFVRELRNSTPEARAYMLESSTKTNNPIVRDIETLSDPEITSELIYGNVLNRNGALRNNPRAAAEIARVLPGQELLQKAALNLFLDTPTGQRNVQQARQIAELYLHQGAPEVEQTDMFGNQIVRDPVPGQNRLRNQTMQIVNSKRALASMARNLKENESDLRTNYESLQNAKLSDSDWEAVLKNLTDTKKMKERLQDSFRRPSSGISLLVAKLERAVHAENMTEEDAAQQIFEASVKLAGANTAAEFQAVDDAIRDDGVFPALTSFYDKGGADVLKDADGNPLTVFHGSPTAKTLKQLKVGEEHAEFPAGIWFAGSRRVAGVYAGKQGPTPEKGVLGAHLRMQNPKVLQAEDLIDTEEVFDKDGNLIELPIYDTMSPAIEAAFEAGHDGVIIRGVVDTSAAYGQRHPSTPGELKKWLKERSTDYYVVRDPKQVIDARQPDAPLFQAAAPAFDVDENGNLVPTAGPAVQAQRETNTARLDSTQGREVPDAQINRIAAQHGITPERLRKHLRWFSPARGELPPSADGSTGRQASVRVMGGRAQMLPPRAIKRAEVRNAIAAAFGRRAAVERGFHQRGPQTTGAPQGEAEPSTGYVGRRVGAPPAVDIHELVHVVSMAARLGNRHTRRLLRHQPPAVRVLAQAIDAALRSDEAVKDLLDIGYFWLQDNKTMPGNVNMKVEEGIAIFVSRWMSDWENANRWAPKLTKAFDAALQRAGKDTPGGLKALQRAQRLTSAWTAQGAGQRADTADGRASWNPRAEFNIWQQLWDAHATRQGLWRTFRLGVSSDHMDKVIPEKLYQAGLTERDMAQGDAESPFAKARKLFEMISSNKGLGRRTLNVLEKGWYIRAEDGDLQYLQQDGNLQEMIDLMAADGKGGRVDSKTLQQRFQSAGEYLNAWVQEGQRLHEAGKSWADAPRSAAFLEAKKKALAAGLTEAQVKSLEQQLWGYFDGWARAAYSFGVITKERMDSLLDSKFGTHLIWTYANNIVRGPLPAARQLPDSSQSKADIPETENFWDYLLDTTQQSLMQFARQEQMRERVGLAEMLQGGKSGWVMRRMDRANTAMHLKQLYKAAIEKMAAADPYLTVQEDGRLVRDPKAPPLSERDQLVLDQILKRGLDRWVDMNTPMSQDEVLAELMRRGLDEWVMDLSTSPTTPGAQLVPWFDPNDGELSFVEFLDPDFAAAAAAHAKVDENQQARQKWGLMTRAMFRAAVKLRKVKQALVVAFPEFFVQAAVKQVGVSANYGLATGLTGRHFLPVISDVLGISRTGAAYLAQAIEPKHGSVAMGVKRFLTDIPFVQKGMVEVEAMMRRGEWGNSVVAEVLKSSRVGSLAELVSRASRDKGKFLKSGPAVKKVLRNARNLMMNASMIFEQAPRVEAGVAARKQGRPEQQIALIRREIAGEFSNQGTSKFVSNAAQTVPFMQARYSSFDTALDMLERLASPGKFTWHDRQTYPRFAAAALMGLSTFGWLLTTAGGDDEKVEERMMKNKFRRYNFIPLGERSAPFGIDSYVAAIQALPLAMLDEISRKDGKHNALQSAWQVLNIFGAQLAPLQTHEGTLLALPPGLQEAAEYMVNKNFYGAPINPSRSSEFGEFTSQPSDDLLPSWISDNTGMKIGTVRLLLGTMGYAQALLSDAINIAGHDAAGKGARPFGAEVVYNQLGLDLWNYGNRQFPAPQVGALYETLQEVEAAERAHQQAKRDAGAGFPDKMRRFHGEHYLMALYGQRKAARRGRKYLNQMWQRRSAVAGDKRLSAAEKERRLLEMNREAEQYALALRRGIQAAVDAASARGG